MSENRIRVIFNLWFVIKLPPLYLISRILGSPIVIGTNKKHPCNAMILDIFEIANATSIAKSTTMNLDTFLNN